MQPICSNLAFLTTPYTMITVAKRHETLEYQAYLHTKAATKKAPREDP